MKEVENFIKKTLKDAESLYNINMSDVDITFKLRGRCLGTASRTYCKKTYKFSYAVNINKNALVVGGKTYDFLFQEVIPHEVAHIVCMKLELPSSHTKTWKNICIQLGGIGMAKYSKEHAPEISDFNRPFKYIFDNGDSVQVSNIIHNKIQKGKTTYKYGIHEINKNTKFIDIKKAN